MIDLSPEIPVPSNITLHRLSKTLELHYEDSGERFDLSCEYLRVHTPSAEARGHAPGQEKLQYGCREVTIDRIEPVGNYALRLIFSDGHDTGLYSWELLYDLARNYQTLWQTYLMRLEQAGLSRESGDGKSPIDLEHWRHRKEGCAPPTKS